ncbi:MAG: patatin-like phospholipase family protein [Rubrivivax sp.]|jgi:NTE family protein|nr:patatin-like phospholipase family protein [Rubrivivax sp.]
MGHHRRALAGLLAAVLSVLLAACQSPPVGTPASSQPGAARIEAAVAGGVTPASATSPRPRRIALALGGGAARGFAHIGVIQVLESQGIRPDIIVGTSAGSLVAALYADGKTGAELESLALTLDESALTDWSLPSRGVLRGDALARWVRQATGGKAIEQLSRPLGIVATDLQTGTGVLFQRGDTGQAVRASSAVPAVFQPVRIAEREYVDGGLVAPVPVRFARQMGATHVIAVDISMPPELGSPDGTLGLLLQTFAIMGRSINQYELREADVVLRPQMIGLSSADMSNRVRAIRAGREAASAQLPALRDKLGLPPAR